MSLRLWPDGTVCWSSGPGSATVCIIPKIDSRLAGQPQAPAAAQEADTAIQTYQGLLQTVQSCLNNPPLAIAADPNLDAARDFANRLANVITPASFASSSTDSKWDAAETAKELIAAQSPETTAVLKTCGLQTL